MSSKQKDKKASPLIKAFTGLFIIILLIFLIPIVWFLFILTSEHLDIGYAEYQDCENIKIVSKPEFMDYGDVFKVYDKQGQFLGRYADNGKFRFEPFKCETNFPVHNRMGRTVVLPDGSLFGGDFFPKLDINDEIAIFATSSKFVPMKGPGLNRLTEYGKHGLIHRSGEILLESVYDDLIYFHDDKLLARIGDERFLIDRQGTTLKPKGDEVLSVQTGQKLPLRKDYINCKDTTKLKSVDGLWGIQTPNGSMIVKPKYEAIFCYTKAIITHPLQDHNGMAPNRAKRAWCHVDSKGEFTEICHEHHPAYGTRTKTVYPEKLVDGDAFENSVAWARQYLDYGEGRAKTPPKLIRFPDRMREGQEGYLYATPFSPVYNGFHESSKKFQRYPYPELDFRPKKKSEPSEE